MAAEKSKTAISLENLEEFKEEMDKAVDKKVEAATTADMNFASSEQIKAIFAE